MTNKLRYGLFGCLFVLSFNLSAQTDDVSLYRTIDGQYNNPNNRQRGATHTALIRLAGDGYVDGQSAPAGPNRPNPRVISNTLFAQEGLLNDPVGLSDYTWVFGQFIDHDIALTDQLGENLPIPVPMGDPDFDPFFFGTVHIPFHRNLPRLGTGFGIGNPRNYDNEITAFVDGSGVYGSDESRANWLRSFEDGKLKVSAGNMLPYNTLNAEINGPRDPNAPFMANGTGFGGALYVAGDVRANENPLLASFHTLFVREHNLQCDRLKQENPDWTDEQLYHHARKLVGGLIQSIVYNEWLPAMGVPVGDYPGYDMSINPQLANSFSAAAFRVGHTLLNGNIRRLDANGEVLAQGNMTLRDAFFNPLALQETGLDPFLRGMAEQTQQMMDSRVVDDVRNFLFGPPGAGGLDLASINIMRGRERGLPSYNIVRRAYGLQTLFEFDAINPDFEVYNTLEELYAGDIDEIDPWVGMLAERPMPGSIFGPTIRKIMEQQFGDLRAGDRFFYLNDPVLTEAEKDWIHNTTFRDVIYRNSGVDLMQENVFEAMPFSEICGGATVAADGLIRVHSTNANLEGVTVSAVDANGEVMSADLTTALGFYDFDELPACRELKLVAELDDDWTNGLDIFDMVDINLHLLGRQEFSSPYQLLAADANGDTEVDVFDIIALARQILGLATSLRPEPELPWIFVPAGYEFENPANPFLENYPTSIDFADVDPADINQGFVAMKRGDVNADAELNVSNLRVGLVVDLPDAVVSAGAERLVEVRFSGDELAGFQLELETEGLELLGVAYTDLPAENYRVAAGKLQLLNLESGAAEHAVVLRVKANSTGNLREMFSIAEDAGRSVAVAADGSPLRVVLGAVAGAEEGFLESKIFPNPFADVVTLNFAAPLETSSTAEILDVNGRVLRTQALPAGTETTRFSGLALPSGTYLLRVVGAAGKVEMVRVLETVSAR
ncbi:peroxidase family protein [Neolewinella persica]|uniref:peroxidase family protein n=1 Tax=Neolewinella persica TaxID=70998 RepID=UPI00036970EB|nr:peroxidase family protein [Neolewinella persica]